MSASTTPTDIEVALDNLESASTNDRTMVQQLILNNKAFISTTEKLMEQVSKAIEEVNKIKCDRWCIQMERTRPTGLLLDAWVQGTKGALISNMQEQGRWIQG